MKSWKTTTLGIIAVLGAVLNVAKLAMSGNVAAIDWPTSVSAFTAGFGLIFAKDSNVTGGTKQQ